MGIPRMVSSDRLGAQFCPSFATVNEVLHSRCEKVRSALAYTYWKTTQSGCKPITVNKELDEVHPKFYLI